MIVIERGPMDMHVAPREEYLWMQKGRYHRPCVPFAGHTTYNSRYSTTKAVRGSW